MSQSRSNSERTGIQFQFYFLPATLQPFFRQCRYKKSRDFAILRVGTLFLQCLELCNYITGKLACLLDGFERLAVFLRIAENLTYRQVGEIQTTLNERELPVTDETESSVGPE
jgi:hypothetical protein